MGDLSLGDSRIFFCSFVPQCLYVLCLAAARLGGAPRVGCTD